MQIYIEGYVLHNLLMNALILALAMRLAGQKLAPARLILASLLGCGYAVACCLPGLRFLDGLVFRALCILLMCLVAIKKRSLARWLRLFLFCLVALVLLGGTGFGLMYMLGAKGYGLLQAALTVLAGAALAVCLCWPLQKKPALEHKITLVLGGQSINLKGYLDTGNALTEPLSGLPVMLVDPACIGGIPLPPGRPVPFSALGGKGVIDAFFPDALFMDGKQVDWYVALYPGPGRLSCEALLPMG